MRRQKIYSARERLNSQYNMPKSACQQQISSDILKKKGSRLLSPQKWANYGRWGGQPPTASSEPDVKLSLHPALQKTGFCHEYLLSGFSSCSRSAFTGRTPREGAVSRSPERQELIRYRLRSIIDMHGYAVTKIKTTFAAQPPPLRVVSSEQVARKECS